MPGFIDLHQHILWGLDDGPETPEEMYALLRADVADGIAVVAATTHVLPGLRPFDMALYRERLKQAQEYCAEQELPLQVIGGAEIGYTPYVASALADRRIPTIGGSEFILLEFWKDVDRKTVEQAVAEVFRHGFNPIIAHIERYKLFQWDLSFILSLKEEFGFLCQVNCDYVLSERILDGFSLRRMQKNGIVDVIATDAHGTVRRPPKMRKTRQYLQKKNADALSCLIELEEGADAKSWKSKLCP